MTTTPIQIPELTEKNKRNFWAKISKSPGLGPKGDCWEWTACVLKDGYGHFGLGGKLYGSHRISYTIKYGHIPKGLLVCHHCDNTRCCNPDHLFIGTHKDNMTDKVNKGRAARLKGIDNGSSKLLEEDVLEIRHRYARGDISQTALALEYRVTVSQISYIVHRKSWQHLPQNENEVFEGSHYAKGTDFGNSKLKEEQVLEIRRRYTAGGVSQTALALEYGVSQMLISLIVRRKNWKHI